MYWWDMSETWVDFKLRHVKNVVRLLAIVLFFVRDNNNYNTQYVTSPLGDLDGRSR